MLIHFQNYFADKLTCKFARNSYFTPGHFTENLTGGAVALA